MAPKRLNLRPFKLLLALAAITLSFNAGKISSVYGAVEEDEIASVDAEPELLHTHEDDFHMGSSAPATANEKPVLKIQDEKSYSPPELKENEPFYLYEPFRTSDLLDKSWLMSTAKTDDVEVSLAKYDGQWKIEEAKQAHLKNDIGLVVKSKAKHHAIATRLAKPFSFDMQTSSTISGWFDYAKAHPWVWGLFLVGLGLPIAFIIMSYAKRSQQSSEVGQKSAGRQSQQQQRNPTGSEDEESDDDADHQRKEEQDDDGELIDSNRSATTTTQNSQDLLRSSPSTTATGSSARRQADTQRTDVTNTTQKTDNYSPPPELESAESAEEEEEDDDNDVPPAEAGDKVNQANNKVAFEQVTTKTNTVEHVPVDMNDAEDAGGATSNLRSRACRELTKQFESVTADLTLERGKLANLQKQFAELSQRYSLLQSQFDLLSKEHATASKEFSRLQTEHVKATKTAAASKPSEEAAQEQASNLRGKISDLQADQSIIDQRAEETCEELHIVSLENDLSNEDAKVSDLRAPLDEARHKGGDARSNSSLPSSTFKSSRRLRHYAIIGVCVFCCSLVCLWSLGGLFDTVTVSLFDGEPTAY